MTVRQEFRATARAGSNIAFLKYWGKRDAEYNIPLNDSLSMTLSDAHTTTTVAWDPDLKQDEIYLDGERILDSRGRRISKHLNKLRQAWYPYFARVVTLNSFPSGTGIASSASGFAALTMAGIAAFGEGLPDEVELSRWARWGSGSACRSIHGGFVEWLGGEDHQSSRARPFLPETAWDLSDVVVLVSGEPKEISSSEGHRIAARHPFMPVRQGLLPSRLLAMKGALAARDLPTLGELLEQEALEVQGIMMSGTPSCLYPTAMTLEVIHRLRRWREEGLPAWFTLDAGPNVHILTESRHVSALVERVRSVSRQLDVLVNRPGGPARLLDQHLL